MLVEVKMRGIYHESDVICDLQRAHILVRETNMNPNAI